MTEAEQPVEFEAEDAAPMEDFTEDNFENDVDMGPPDEFSIRGGRGAPRGAFRGRGARGWMGPGPPPRFRGRGFGPGGPPPGFRGRGPPPGMFGRGGPPPPRAGFNGPPNFNGPNWAGGPPPMGPPPLLRPPGSGSTTAGGASGAGKEGTNGEDTSPGGPGSAGAPPQFPPPGMMPPNMVAGGPPPNMINYPNPTTPVIDPTQEIWVETKSGEGKSYYYHARTRDTTWTKPEGANVKIISQDQVEAMAQAATSTAQMQPGTTTAAQAALAQASISNKPDDESKHEMIKQPPPMGPNGMQPPPGMMQGPPPGQIRFGGPPGGQFPPFGMPPPGFPGGGGGPWGPGAPPPWATGGMPPGPAPWMTPGMMPPPIQVAPPSAAAAVDEAAVMSKIDPEIIAKATEWTEHKAPDGRFYYYHGKRAESVWEKPQEMKDLETAKLAAQQGISTRPKIETGNIEEMLANKQLEVKAFELAKQKEAEEERKKKQQQQEEDAARRKKEDEEKAKEQKAQDKSRPVSSTPVPGTPWCVVWTGDGRVFFYNPSSRTSVWERPEDLIGRSDVDKMVATAPDAVSKDTGAAIPGGKSAAGAGAADGGAKDRKRTDSDDSDSDDDVPSKKAKKDDVSGTNGVQQMGAKKIDIGKDSAMEAEVKAAKERALIPLDSRIKSFKEMLAEKEVSAFSTWEKELHKIVFDQRYLLLTSKERKQVFEKYVKERAEDERREKRNKLREKKDLYRKMLTEAHLHGKSVFSDFAIKYVKDERFKGVEKMRERESLFNEYLIDVRRREKEEKTLRREQIKKDFFTMLREHPDVDRHARWPEIKKKFEADQRYRAVDSSSQKEDWFREYGKMLKDEKKKAKEKEKEHKREKDKDKHKKKDKDGEKHSKERKKSESAKSDKSDRTAEDANTSTVSSSAAGKEGTESGEYASNAANITKEGDPEPEVEDITSDDDKQMDGIAERDAEDDGVSNEQKEKERQARAEASMREREKEVQRTLATHMRDRDKEREQHKRDESIQHFNALLADLVRNADSTWREVKRVLRKDHRWDLAEALQREEKEKLYGEHVEQLMRKKRDKFRELLDETTAVTLTSPWKEIKKLVKEDPRYTKFASSERCEREYKDYLKDKLIGAKGQFKELLQETKLITHKSLTTLRESQGHMAEIEEILKNDKRFLVLDHIPQERTQLILNYLEELDRRGPPPPPTASEPSRRSKM